jgi:hypothetical protein
VHGLPPRLRGVGTPPSAAAFDRFTFTPSWKGPYPHSSMSLLLSTLLVASTVTLPSCSWDRPGADPYMGDIEAAVDRYRDIPPEVRAKLKAKMRTRAYDDIATITRDKIEGKGGPAGKQTYSNLRDMHFGKGRICREVTRSKWKPDAVERGLVYCEGEHCLIVPTVCRNVSRVTPDELNPEPKAGEDEDPPPTAMGANVLGGQRFVDITDPLPARPLSVEPPAGELPIETAQGPPTPPDVPRDRFSDPVPPTPPTPIPEPSTWALMGLGVALVGAATRRRRQAAGQAPATDPRG